jgi:hypothetical protein
LKRRYNVDYSISQKPAYIFPLNKYDHQKVKYIIYQGAVNEGRSFETLIPAMKQVDATLKIFGKGNFFDQTKHLITGNKLDNKIDLAGYVVPQQLKELTQQLI